MINKNLTMIDISYIVSNVFKNDNISCIVNDDNASNLILQLRLLDESSGVLK